MPTDPGKQITRYGSFTKGMLRGKMAGVTAKAAAR
jgi:hypothetical protein